MKAETTTQIIETKSSYFECTHKKNPIFCSVL